ncbi:MAG: zf-HC2 domain-containing protein [Bacteroidota bacterium]
MNNNDVSCKDVMNHICDNLGEEMNSPRCRLIKEHLQQCSSCQKYFRSIESTIQFYKNYNVSLSSEAHKKLFDMLGLED